MYGIDFLRIQGREKKSAILMGKRKNNPDLATYQFGT